MARFPGLWLALVTTVAAPVSVRAGEDVQWWQWVTVDLLNNEQWRMYLYLDNRHDFDEAESFIQVVSPRVKFHADEHLDLGLGLSLLHVNPLSPGDDYLQYRTEFEFNPKFAAGPFSIHNRNRLELRWNDGQGKPRPRIRNRLQATCRLGDGQRLLKSLYTNNEFFFALDGGGYSENRFIPLGLELKLNDHASVSLFYMVQSAERAGGWESTHIVGSMVKLGF